MKIPPIAPIHRAIFSPNQPQQRRQDMKWNNIKVTEIDQSAPPPPEDETTEPDISTEQWENLAKQMSDSVDDIERRANDMFFVLVAVFVVVITALGLLLY